MRQLNVLIADDEPLIRSGLRQALEAMEGVVVAGEAGSGRETILAIRSLAPDAVLLDVQMPDGDGLEVVREIGAEHMPAVVFVTAFDDYAVHAIRINAVDYILKPFDRKRLAESIDRVRRRLHEAEYPELRARLDALLEMWSRERRWPDRLVVRAAGGVEFVKVDEIDWIEAADNCAVLHCGARTHVVPESLAGIAQRLNPERFVRVHRSRVVNTGCIRRMHPLFHGEYEVVLNDGTRLTTGRGYRAAVQRLVS